LKSSYVFDTGPLHLSFAGDRRVTEPLREVGKGIADGYTCESNLAELYYKTCERLGRETALLRYTSLRQSALSITAPDDALTRLAGELKCSHKTDLSLVDAYIIALTKRTGATLYTTDPRIARLRVVPTKLIEL
jgi:predicted nucleic acid-binding protein